MRFTWNMGGAGYVTIARLFPSNDKAAADIHNIGVGRPIIYNEDLLGLKVVQFEIIGCSMVKNQIGKYNLSFGGDITVKVPRVPQNANDINYHIWTFRVSYTSAYTTEDGNHHDIRFFRIQLKDGDNFNNNLPDAIGEEDHRIIFGRYLILITSAIYKHCLNVAKEGIWSTVSEYLGSHEFWLPIYTTVNQQIIQSSFRTMLAEKQNDNDSHPNTTKGLELSLSNMVLPTGDLPIHDVELNGAFRISFKSNP